MRIACNFADGAKELITLVIGLSVIRPLLFLAGSTAFEAAGLHLLREYGKRGSPVLEFKDFELVLCKSVCFSFGSFDAGEDLLGVLGPGERRGVVVPAVDERADGVGELAD